MGLRPPPWGGISEAQSQRSTCGPRHKRTVIPVRTRSERSPPSSSFWRKSGGGFSLLPSLLRSSSMVIASEDRCGPSPSSFLGKKRKLPSYIIRFQPGNPLFRPFSILLLRRRRRFCVGISPLRSLALCPVCLGLVRVSADFLGGGGGDGGGTRTMDARIEPSPKARFFFIFVINQGLRTFKT